MHLLACFPGRKMFVLRTCPIVFNSFLSKMHLAGSVQGVGVSREIDTVCVTGGDDDKLAEGFKILA